MTHVRGLVCRECGRGVPQSPVHVCEHCFGPLEIDYDYAAIRAVLTRDRVAAGPPSIWRYRDLLPLDDEPVVVPAPQPPQAQGTVPVVNPSKAKAERVAMEEVREGLVDWTLPDFKAVFDTR